MMLERLLAEPYVEQHHENDHRKSNVDVQNKFRMFRLPADSYCFFIWVTHVHKKGRRVENAWHCYLILTNRSGKEVLKAVVMLCVSVSL